MEFALGSARGRDQIDPIAMTWLAKERMDRFEATAL
jgi:hypothetical protein